MTSLGAIRTWYALDRAVNGEDQEFEQGIEEFDRAMRAVKAEAWSEGFRDGLRQHAEGEDGPKFTNPYREGVS